MPIGDAECRPSCENRRTQVVEEDHPMDKGAKNPKKPKQTKTKEGAAKGK